MRWFTVDAIDVFWGLALWWGIIFALPAPPARFLAILCSLELMEREHAVGTVTRACDRRRSGCLVVPTLSSFFVSFQEQTIDVCVALDATRFVLVCVFGVFW